VTHVALSGFPLLLLLRVFLPRHCLGDRGRQRGLADGATSAREHLCQHSRIFVKHKSTEESERCGQDSPVFLKAFKSVLKSS